VRFAHRAAGLVPSETPRPGGGRVRNGRSKGPGIPGRGLPCPVVRRSDMGHPGVSVCPRRRALVFGPLRLASPFALGFARRAVVRSPAPHGHDLRPRLGADHSPGRARWSCGSLDPERSATTWARSPGQFPHAQLWLRRLHGGLRSGGRGSSTWAGRPTRSAAHAARNAWRRTRVPCPSWSLGRRTGRATSTAAR
jgi:hypothetical protein